MTSMTSRQWTTDLMWLPKSDMEPGIRQGDLFLDIPFALVKDNADRRDLFVRPVERLRAAIAITHCCVVENQHRVTLARVDLKKGLPSKLLSLYTADDPAEIEASTRSRFPFREWLLPSTDQLPEPLDNEHYLARLTHTEDFVEPWPWLEKRRAAQLDVTSRRALRIKLAYLFGRAEPDDRTRLQALGVQPSFTSVA